jgi:putative addiction module component (TIGR02574 family)
MIASLSALGIDKWSVEDRMELIDRIWDSISGEPSPPPITDAQRRDLDRRLAEHAADPTAGSSWEDVESRLLGRP